MKRDITTGVEWKQILLFSLPILLGNLLQQLYNTVDGIVVGNYVGETALAAVGSSSELGIVFLALAIGMSGGASILIAQLYGARHYDQLRRTVSTMLILLGVLGAVVMGLCLGFSRWMLESLLNVRDEAVLELGLQYFNIYALGLICQFVYNCVSSILRAVGDSRASLYFLAITVTLNLFLDLLFVIVFRWGVMGAAAATVLSQLLCVIVSILYMQKKYEVLRVTRGSFRFDRGICRTCLKLGIPTTLQQCVLSFGHIFSQRLVNSFGATVMSASFIAGRIMSYIFLPCSAFNIGMSTFTAQNVGAGKLDRVRRGLRGIIIAGVIICLCMAGLVFGFAAPLSRIFGVEAEALRISVDYLRCVAFFVPLMAIYMPTTGVLQGSGDVMWSTACTMTCFAVRLAAAYLMAYSFDVGVPSLYVCMPISWIVTVVVGLGRYSSGKWQTKALVGQKQEGRA